MKKESELMPKSQWCVLLCIFIIYLLLGASIFFYVESKEERKKSIENAKEKKVIENLLKKYFIANNNTQEELFYELTKYCGKPIGINMSEEKETYKWNFYNSVFFVITVVSTIGYGNLSPTTMFTKLFMIFYSLIGIPMNGIVMVTLGEFFGKSIKKLYQRWKSSQIDYDLTKIGLIGQIILYLVPGFTFFIFLPSTVMSVFEGWPYYDSVYYCYVTLTTIGFGDYVAGTGGVYEFGTLYFVYKFFLLVWVIGGLGYIVMLLSFITQGLRSKRIVHIEQMLSDNIMNTPKKIRQELRNILHEFLFLRVKPVYKNEFEYVPHHLERRQSCPDLQFDRKLNSPTMSRKRAMSESYRPSTIQEIDRTQSDTDLQRIDKELTFKPSDAFMHQTDLLLKVVDALTLETSDNPQHSTGASEPYNHKWYIGGNRLNVPQRRRAISDIRPPVGALNVHVNNEHTWYGGYIDKSFSEYMKTVRANSIPENARQEKLSLFQRIKNRFAIKDDKNVDVERQANIETEKTSSKILIDGADAQYQRRGSVLSTKQERVLEETSIADFIRALSAIAVPEILQDTASDSAKNSPLRRRRNAIQSNYESRRCSLAPAGRITGIRDRRYSLRPIDPSLFQNSSLTRETKFSRGGGDIRSRFPNLRTLKENEKLKSTDMSVETSSAAFRGRSGSMGDVLAQPHSFLEKRSPTGPPPYSHLPPDTKPIRQRKFSVRPTNLAQLNVTGPVQRQVTKRERTETESSDK